MQDNATYDLIEMLVRYMDGELSETEQAATEKLLREDAEVQARYQNLLNAKQAIKSQGLKERMQAIHNEYTAQSQAVETTTVKMVKPAFGVRSFMRIAAVFIIVVAGYGIYQYAATNSQSMFQENYISYELPVARGSEQTTNIDALYNAHNYTAVIDAVNAKQPKNQKDYFLAALSYLNTNNATASIDAFKQVVTLNNTAAEKYFAQETDYYLALAYIKAGNIDEAKKQLDKITSNKQHMFYDKANDVSKTKLMFLKWKE